MRMGMRPMHRRPSEGCKGQNGARDLFFRASLCLGLRRRLGCDVVRCCRCGWLCCRCRLDRVVISNQGRFCASADSKHCTSMRSPKQPRMMAPRGIIRPCCMCSPSWVVDFVTRGHLGPCEWVCDRCTAARVVIFRSYDVHSGSAAFLIHSFRYFVVVFSLFVCLNMCVTLCVFRPVLVWFGLVWFVLVCLDG